MRQFKIIKVDYGKFIKESDKIKYYDNTRGKKNGVRFGTFNDETTYSTIDNIVQEFEDDKPQELIPIIPYKINLDTALIRIKKNKKAYFRQIMIKENSANFFDLIRITKDINGKIKFDRRDILRFRKENGVWILRLLNIPGRNFGMYNLTPAIISVREGRKNYRLLKAINITPYNL